MNRFHIRQLLGSAAAILLLAGVVAEPGRAQQSTVAGQVTDKSNQQPVAGAQVMIVGTSLQARSGREGRYAIAKVPTGQLQVQVRLIGFATATQPVTVAAGETATLDFALTPAAVPLDVVIVSATGQEQLKRELGNTVGTIDAAKVTQEASPVNAADLLNSRVPGVEVLQSGGTTGSGSRIRIRGATSLSLRNEPIVVVDGVRIDNTPNADGGLGVGGQAPSRLNDLNSDDIEAIEVVKGPSAAALYGTDAANGVIQIRTKQGRPGPTKWTAFSEGGTLNEETKWPANYAALDGAANLCLVSDQAQGLCTIARVDSFNPLMQNSPFRQGVRQHYGLSVSGGNEVTTFYLSGDHQREKGIYESNDLKKTSLRANMHNTVSRLLDLSANVGYVSSLLALPQNDNNDQGILPSGLLGLPASFFPDTTNGGYLFLTPQQANLISTTQRVERFTGGLTLNFRPASFLAMRGTLGYDVTNQSDNELTPPNVIPLDQTRLDGNAFQFRAQIFSYTANFSTQASLRLSSILTSNTTVGVQYYKNVFAQTRASGRKIVAGCSALACVVTPAVGDTTAPFVTLGGYIEEQIGVRDRLYLTGAVRADKNSAFGTSFRNILYPKLSGSWVISEEPFFPRMGWLSSLRVRAAWGKSGRAPGVLDALQFYQPVAVAASGSDVPGVTIGGAGNTNLKPEQTQEIETGFDADMINQRLHFEATYYNKDSKDALVAVPVAPSLGSSFTRLDNLGEVSNKGFELALTAQLVNTPNLTWSVTTSAWGNKNRVLKTDSINTPIIFGLGGASQRHQVGYAAGGYWGTPYTFRDLNGDGMINPDTLTGEITIGSADAFQGSSVPTRGATISTELNFLSRFRLFGLLDGRWGNRLDNSTESFRCINPFLHCAGLNLTTASLSDQAAAIASAFYNLETGYFQDAGFVKLREVSLTYFAPPAWASRIGASSLNLTLTGRNLATWTNYKGADPELNTIGQFNFSVADFLTQPPVRYFLARINVTF
jgi:TonB-linked SusC/RagA family outer membrane protein